MRLPWIWIPLCAAISVGLLIGPPQADAETVSAYFDDGNSDTLVDAYPGVAGGGWAGPWQTAGYSAGGVMNCVVKESGDAGYSPIDGGGNYLYCESVIEAYNGAASLARDYSDGIDVTQDHVITFQFRVDEDVTGALWDNKKDTYSMFDAVAVLGGTSGDCRWQIDGKASMGNWGIVHPVAGYVETGIVIAQGVVYDFEITIHADTHMWDLKIDDGTNVYDSTTDDYPDGIDFRAGDVDVGGIIHFNGKGDDADDVRAFSVDNLVIIPEPSTAVFVLVGVLFGSLLRRRDSR